jgi:AraC-like DNA-binding protein
MDEICAIISKTANWANCVERMLIPFASNCRFRIDTKKRPLLEFYLICGRHKIEISVGNKQKIVQPGEIMILNSHLGNSGISKSWNYWCVSLNIGGIPLFQDIESGPLLLTAQAKNTAKLINCYKLVINNRRQLGPFCEIKTKIAILSLLTAFWENVANETLGGYTYSAPIEKALEKMHSDYFRSNLDLAQLAAASHCSIDHFGRIFKEEVGITPMKYLVQKRITYACELIDRGHLSMKEIAFQVGLPDPQHFSRLFHILTGMSPREYRNRAQKTP